MKKLIYILAVALTAFAGSMATAIQYDRFETNILNNRTDAVSHSYAYVDAIDPHGQQWKCYCLLYTSPSPRDRQKSRMPSSA